MSARARLGVVLGILAFVSVVGACGGSGPGPAPAPAPPADGGGGGTEPEPALDGATVWVDRACDICHGDDGSGGIGPALTCYPADGLAVFVRSLSTPHVLRPILFSDEEATAVATFLGQGGCSDHVPVSHTVARGVAGIRHMPSVESPELSCTPCHGGPDLEGYGSVPSCATCHGGGAGGIGCVDCHDSPQDNGDGIPVGGRRAITGEFALASHHGPGTPASTDCLACHDVNLHQQGSVRLFDADDPSVVVALADHPSTVASEAIKLEPICLACHDADAAGGSAPFSDGVTPAVIDAGAWSASRHAVVGLTCAGDGSTFGCHVAAHGSAYDGLLHADYVTQDPNNGSSSDYQACWACHSASSILSGQNAFGEYHQKHVSEEGAACVTCHDVHGAYDASERGLISFERALAQGWLTIPSGTTLSSAFVATSSGGNCTLRCHGETHAARGYAR